MLQKNDLAVKMLAWVLVGCLVLLVVRWRHRIKGETGTRLWLPRGKDAWRHQHVQLLNINKGTQNVPARLAFILNTYDIATLNIVHYETCDRIINYNVVFVRFLLL